MAKFLYYSHLLALSSCRHAALLAEQHKLALLVPGGQVEVLLKQTDQAIKYHMSLKLKHVQRGSGRSVNVHFNFHLNISDNEHEVQGSRLGKVTPQSSTFLECLWPFATGASVVMWNPQRPAAYNYGQYHWIRQVQIHSLYLYYTRSRQPVANSDLRPHQGQGQCL